MKIERVILHNVRQFRGTQEVHFSIDPLKRVTVFRAPNTSGKTTLLNAVFWCLYGEFLPGFDEPERLLSSQPTEQKYSVEVRFHHRDKLYIARRQGTSDPRLAEFRVLESAAAGVQVPHPKPELLISSILPKPLATFFFFAGEYLKHSSTTENTKQTTESIRAVLGFKLAQQTIEDLMSIRRKKQKELQAMSAGTDIADITEKLAELESYVELRAIQLIQQRELISQLETQKEERYEILRNFESTAVMQSKRDRNAQQLASALKSLNQALLAKQQLISHLGPALYIAEGAQVAANYIDDAVTKKRLPSPFDKTFVKDILDEKTCICGRCIELGSPEFAKIASLINSATDEVVLRRALAVKGVAGSVVKSSMDAPRQFRQCLSTLGAAKSVVIDLEQDQAMISEQMRKHEASNVRAAEAELVRIEKTLRELEGSRKNTEEGIVAAKVNIESKRKELERAQGASPAVSAARTQLEILERIIAHLEDALSKSEKEGLTHITARLNDVVMNATRTKYTAEVSADYSLHLFKNEPDIGTVPVKVLSSGERRLLTLCFLSALVSVCREREKDESAVVLPGAIAPMMVDAPFGELDPGYQALAARNMTDRSDQLVLMVSDTHYTPPVQEAIGDYVGIENVLISYKRDSAGTAAPVQLVVRGETIDQMIYMADHDWTEVRQLGVTR